MLYQMQLSYSWYPDCFSCIHVVLLFHTQHYNAVDPSLLGPSCPQLLMRSYKENSLLISAPVTMKECLSVGQFR